MATPYRVTGADPTFTAPRGTKAFRTDTQQEFINVDGSTTWKRVYKEGDTLASADVDAAGVTMNTDTNVSGNSWVLDEDNMASDDATKVPTQQSVKSYVDGAVVGLYDHKGGYDAATNSPDLDVSPSGIKKGDAYTVSVAGNFFTEAVEVGDVLIADKDNPTVLTDWTRVNKNISFGTTAGTACEGNDARLSDERTPLDNSATNAKLADMAQSLIKGRAAAAGTGDPQDLTAAQVRTIINVADGANNYSHPNHTGDVTSAGDGAQTIADEAVTYAKMQHVSAASRLLGLGAAAGAGDVEEIVLGANLSMSGTTLNASGGGGTSPLVINRSAGQLEATEANIAPLVVLDEGTVNVTVALFDDTTEEYRNATFHAPSDIDGAGTVTFRAYVYALTAAASKNVQMRFGHRAIANGEALDGAYTNEDSGDVAIDATQDDVTLVEWTETVSNLGWAAEDLIVCRWSRIDATANDLVGDLCLIGTSIEIPRA